MNLLMEKVHDYPHDNELKIQPSQFHFPFSAFYSMILLMLLFTTPLNLISNQELTLFLVLMVKYFILQDIKQMSQYQIYQVVLEHHLRY